MLSLRERFVITVVGCALLRLYQPKLPSDTFLSTISTPFAFFILYSTLFIIKLVHLSIIYPYFTSPIRHLPAPEGGKWIVGHLLDLHKQGFAVMARKWFAEIPGSPGLFRVPFIFNVTAVYVRSPVALSEIFVKKSYDFEKVPGTRRFLAWFVGWGLLTAEGDEHKRQRRDLMPAFSFRHIKDLYPLFWSKSCEVVRAMATEIEQNADANGVADMEIASWSTRTGLDIIGLAAAGIDFGSIQNADNPLANAYYLLNPDPSDLFLVQVRAVLPEWIAANLPMKRVRGINKASAAIRNACRELVKDKKRKLANKEDIGFDIASVAMQSGRFNDEQLVDQMLTFLSAGHETTASALVWSIYLLSKYPAVQDKLRAEIREALPSPDDADAKITSAEIDGLSYLTAVCNEVLRTYSPVQATARMSVCDTSLDGQFIPKGTRCVVPIAAINTDPLLWGPDAAEFRPERWLSPEQGGTSVNNAASGGADTNYAFTTFIHGPRSCIGNTFSKSEMACILAAWVGRFSFELKDKSLLDERNLKVNTSVVAKPEGGLHMLVKAIDGW